MTAPPRLVKWLPVAYTVAVDVAAAITATLVYFTFVELTHGPVPLGYVVAFFVGAPLAVRRRWPLAAYSVVVVAQNTATLLHITLEVYTPTLFALYLVAVALPRRRSTVALLGGLALTAVCVTITEPWPDDLGITTFVWLLMVTTWALGWTTRVRREYVGKKAEEEAERALTEERLRIARELHDIVAHSLTMITVKAGIANHVADDHPAEAKEALQVIEKTSRATLTEMRHLLGVLRSSDTPDLTPVPGMSDLPTLVDRAAMAGVPVTLTTTGTTALPDGVALAVYRIVQESVTNVVKHAAPAECTVKITTTDTTATVEVTDNGRGERVLAGGNGHGLAGMRERVAMYNGTFTAGPDPRGGGFRVAAELPFA
ncbi:sensor histidine kinase [Umezawaea endophytica]|uniref:histidine kinase n=1 Tax=Umezawaea endophytica TaxID=1654476 RepID=A0A9X2VX32_9PSEU|nr:sensor histidine kinase [Umezawaea endophytica]MCS7484551.1 sensor histidine kinase [Umezawaea endophytica]